MKIHLMTPGQVRPVAVCGNGLGRLSTRNLPTTNDPAMATCQKCIAIHKKGKA